MPDSAVEAERPGEVETLKAKLAASAAAAEPETTRDVLKAKSVEGATPRGTVADDELTILKAKSRKRSRRARVTRRAEVETLKAKLAADAVTTRAEAKAYGAPAAKQVEQARPKPSSRAAGGTVSVRAKVDLADEAAGWIRESAFDLAFALVLGLWGIGLGLALTVGAQWWFFIFCLAATAAVLLFGLFDSTSVGQQAREK